MPLRDHFHPPISDLTSWDSLHGAWPTMLVIDLNKKLPPEYVASPRVRLGASFEIDVATSRGSREPSSYTMEQEHGSRQRRDCSFSAAAAHTGRRD